MNSRAEFFRNNPMAVRTCILYDCMDGMPVWRAYHHLCAKCGGDVIEYVEFEFWFMRFARGESDINYDRSLEPKTRTFSDLPADIIEIFGKELNFSERLIARHVSKFLKQIADNWIPSFKNASIEIDHGSTTLKIDELQFVYNSYVIPSKYKSHWKFALSHWFILLKNHKDQVEKIYFKYSNYEKIEEILEAIKALDLKIKAPIVEILANDSAGEMAILPFLEPGTLKEITININEPDRQTEFTNLESRIETISQIEQCQQAESLKMEIRSSGPFSFPTEHFLNYTNLNLNFNSLLPTSEVLRITRVLIMSTRLKTFYLTAFSDFTIDNLTNQFDESPLELPGRPNVRYFTIPNSVEWFEFDLIASYNNRIELTIKRMS